MHLCIVLNPNMQHLIQFIGNKGIIFVGKIRRYAVKINDFHALRYLFKLFYYFNMLVK